MARTPTGTIIKSIVDDLDNPVICIDREGRVVVFNASSEALFGISAENISGRYLWDVVENSDFTRTLVAMIKESAPAPREQIMPFSGNRIFLVKAGPVKNTDGRIVGARAILNDLTAFHQIEKTMNEFVATVSHELKTPLTSIKGFVETLLEGALTDQEVTRRFLHVINEETNRMTRLVISLLDLSRASHGKTAPPVLQPVEMDKVIQNAVKMFQHSAGEKNIEILVDVPDDLPACMAEEDKMSQVMINLLDNSIKFTGISGKSGKITIKATHTGDSLEIRITDTGIGIPPEETKKIFEKFYRVTSGPSAELGGTGLGLTITREILNNYGGKIRVESEPDKGSTFTVSLPVRVKQR